MDATVRVWERKNKIKKISLDASGHGRCSSSSLWSTRWEDSPSHETGPLLYLTLIYLLQMSPIRASPAFWKKKLVKGGCRFLGRAPLGALAFPLSAKKKGDHILYNFFGCCPACCHTDFDAFSCCSKDYSSEA